MGSYSEASRVHERFTHQAIEDADRAARKTAASHAAESTCLCVGTEALAAALRAMEGPAAPTTPTCQEAPE